MKYYPLALNLQGRLVVVVGGGKVAQRKVRNLLRVGAKISIVSPNLTTALKRLALQKKLRWIRRKIRITDLKDTEIVISATSDSKVNKSVSRWAKMHNLWVNVVDEPRLSNFISPAIFYKGKAIIAVYTDAKDPVLSRDLKNYLKEEWNGFLSYRNRLQRRSH